MKALQQLRMKQGLRILEKRRLAATVPHYSVSFGQAERIGLLFQAGSLADVQSCKDFFQYLKEAGKHVEVLGYAHSADETAFKTKSVFFEYFSEKDLDFFYIPRPQKTKDFLHKPFDILINLSPEDCFPLDFLSALSAARFRVGRYAPAQVAYYDLMIHLKEERNIDNFVLQLKQYLLLPASV